jgi:hypothetical protein
MKSLSLFLLLIVIHLNAEQAFEINKLEYQYLDQLTYELNPNQLVGKGSRWHDYMRVYALYFAPLKEKRLKLLEIGIQYGDSVKLWENYFKNAELHFIDICLDKVSYFSPRAHYHIADQENRSQLLNVMATTGGNFDIIIDDGGHTMSQQIVSFITLFPYLKSGGMYIIEDLHTSYWRELGPFKYNGNGSLEHPQAGNGTTIQFLKDLIDDVNYAGARTARANYIAGIPENERNIYREQILGIHFYDSMCIIIKRE